MTSKRQRASLLSTDQTTKPGKMQRAPRPSGVTRRLELVTKAGTKKMHQAMEAGPVKIKIDNLQTFEALTENQQKFFDLYKSGSSFMGLFGSAGVGKTFLAIYKALEEVLDKSNSYSKVVIVRSAVQVREQGAVPGTLEEKMSIYETPYADICTTLFGRSNAWNLLKEQDTVKFVSTTAIRGTSYDDCIIVVDEATNLNWAEISAVMTRIGTRSKIIFCGDMRQNDLTKKKTDVSGLSDFLKIARSMNSYQEVNFTTADIVRSALVREWIIAAESFGY